MTTSSSASLNTTRPPIRSVALLASSSSTFQLFTFLLLVLVVVYTVFISSQFFSPQVCCVVYEVSCPHRNSQTPQDNEASRVRIKRSINIAKVATPELDGSRWWRMRKQQQAAGKVGFGSSSSSSKPENVPTAHGSGDQPMAIQCEPGPSGTSGAGGGSLSPSISPTSPDSEGGQSGIGVPSAYLSDDPIPPPSPFDQPSGSRDFPIVKVGCFPGRLLQLILIILVRSIGRTKSRA